LINSSEPSLVESLNKMVAEFIIGLGLAAVTGGAGWLGVKLRKHLTLPEKVESMQADITYLRERIDNVYDALINK